MVRLLFPLRFTQWLGPLFAGGAVALLIAVLVVVTGIVDLSAAKPHPAGWARFLHYTFDRSTAFHAGGPAPADLDSPIRITAGAAYYGQVCARCHGGPGFGQNPVVLSMHPRPQYLVTDLPAAGFTSGELFRIVKAGVKYSAMPSWPADGRDDEIWHIVAFLRQLPAMSPATFRRLALVAPGDGVSPGDGVPGEGVTPGVGAAPIPFGPVPPRRLYALRNDHEPPVTSYSYRSPAFGFSGYALGGNPVAMCSRCHGADGAGGGAFPNLTIQTRDYTARTLAAFAAGKRHSGYMQMVATELSPGQIDALADHYAALPRRAAEPPRAVPAVGRQLATVGVPAAGLASCTSCHGATGASARAFPLLAGQASWYLANQMRVFRAGGRGTIQGDKLVDPMVAIARKLDNAQIDAVAAYYAALPPAAARPAAGAIAAAGETR